MARTKQTIRSPCRVKKFVMVLDSSIDEGKKRKQKKMEAKDRVPNEKKQRR